MSWIAWSIDASHSSEVLKRKIVEDIVPSDNILIVLYTSGEG